MSDHVCVPADASDEAGVYRVVGTSEDAVSLLRVTDADGRRRHTGEVVTVVERPLAGGAALALVIVGLLGDRFLSLPVVFEAVSILLGGLSLLFLSRSGGPPE